MNAPYTAADTPETWGQALRAFCGYASPRLIAVLLLTALLLRATQGPPVWSDLLAILSGLAIWPLLEWTLHRYLLHMRPWQWRGHTVDFAFAREHRAHHAQPWRPELIFLPVYLHALFTPLLLGVAWFAAPERAPALAMLAGFAAAALNYEWTHFVVHSRIHPRGRYYRRLFRNHRLHHFRNERYWYSFTVTGIDRLLGTGPDPDSVPRSPHCYDLGVPPGNGSR
jgi:hypothetical protein